MNAFNGSMLGIFALCVVALVWISAAHVGFIDCLRAEWHGWRLRAERRRWARRMRDLDARTGDD